MIRALRVALPLGIILSSTPYALAQPFDGSSPSARTESLLGRMTLEEKIGQLNLHFLNLTDEIVDDDVKAGNYGSFLYARDAAHTNYLQHLAVDQSRLHIPLLMGFDVVSGYRTIFPPSIAMASSWDPALVEATAAVAAREARAVGVNWIFAPMVDIARDPRWGRIVEGAGEDPFLGSAMAAAQVRGFQGPRLGTPGRVLATVKHFAGYGAPLGGRDYEESAIPDSLLWNVYLPPFQAAIDAGVGSVMSAYMDLNDVPATGNRWLLRDVLRDTLGFRGFVVSDAFAVRALIDHGFARNERDAADRAAQAGINVDMDGRVYRNQLANLVRDKRASAAQVDALVRPVLEAKVRLGLFENPYTDESQSEAVLTAPEHRAMARHAAERTAVLLKNENETLPLKGSAGKSIAVIGPLADSGQDIMGPWTTRANYQETTTILTGIRGKVAPSARVDHAQGVQIRRKFPSEFDQFFEHLIQEPWPEAQASAEFDKAVALAGKSDLTVLVLGEAFNMSGENASRSSLDLPGDQQKLLEAIVATGKPVVLVLINGRPLNITWAASHVPAILEAWYPGTEGGHAVANLLFGDATPGGKLSFTWPRNIGQVPIYYAHNSTMSAQQAARRTWDEESTPLFPFGFGLSYARFAHSNLRLTRSTLPVGGKIEISVDVENTSDHPGDEVVQLYIHQRAGSAARPVRELKGFRRVTLAPHAKTSERFVLGPEDLSYWSATERKRVQETEDFDVWVGTDSNATLHESFSVRP